MKTFRLLLFFSIPSGTLSGQNSSAPAATPSPVISFLITLNVSDLFDADGNPRPQQSRIAVVAAPGHLFAAIALVSTEVAAHGNSNRSSSLVYRNGKVRRPPPDEAQSVANLKTAVARLAAREAEQ